jgi:hypothetical protein
MDRIEVNVQTGEVKIIVEEPVPTELEPTPEPELEPTSEPEPVPE